MRFVPEVAARIDDQSRLFPRVGARGRILADGSSPPPATQNSTTPCIAAYDLGVLIPAGRPDLLIHGHAQDSCNYRIHEIWVVCNPRGYRYENGSFNSRQLSDLAVSSEALEGTK